MADDIEHLKRTKIPLQRDGKLHLPQVGSAAPTSAATTPEQVDEVVVQSPEPVAYSSVVEALHARIVTVLKTIRDPEIPVNIYDLGLVYGIDVEPSGSVNVAMTLTAPACPVAGALVREVATKVGHVLGVTEARVKLVWEPPWTMDRMTEEAKLDLGLI